MAYATTHIAPNARPFRPTLLQRIAEVFLMLSDATAMRRELMEVSQLSDAQLAARGTDRAALVRAIVTSRGMY